MNRSNARHRSNRYLFVNISSNTLNVGAPTFFSQTKDLARSFPSRTRPPSFSARTNGNLFKNDLMSALDWSQCAAVESSPEKVSGAWVFRGTRMPVATVFENLEAGATIEDIMANVSP
jgi:hypothetical protein